MGARGEAKFFGGDGVLGDDAVVDFGVAAGAGDGELVQTLRAAGAALCVAGFSVDYEGVAGVEEGHGLRGEWDEVGGVDSHDLRGGSGGVGERADDVEDGADAECPADGHDGLHGGMERGCVEEGEAMFAEGGCAFVGRESDGDAEGFEDIG